MAKKLQAPEKLQVQSAKKSIVSRDGIASRWTWIETNSCLHLYRWTKRVRCPDKSEDFLIFLRSRRRHGWFACIYSRTGAVRGRIQAVLVVGYSFLVDVACQFQDLCLHLYRCTKRVRCRTNWKIFQKVLNLEQKGVNPDKRHRDFADSAEANEGNQEEWDFFI